MASNCINIIMRFPLFYILKDENALRFLDATLLTYCYCQSNRKRELNQWMQLLGKLLKKIKRNCNASIVFKPIVLVTPKLKAPPFHFRWPAFIPQTFCAWITHILPRYRAIIILLRFRRSWNIFPSVCTKRKTKVAFKLEGHGVRHYLKYYLGICE